MPNQTSEFHPGTVNGRFETVLVGAEPDNLNENSFAAMSGILWPRAFPGHHRPHRPAGPHPEHTSEGSMTVKSLVTLLFAALTVSCSESFLAGTEDPAPLDELSVDGMIMRYGAVIRIDSLYPIAVAPAGHVGMPHRILAFNGYFLCPSPAGLVRREVETVTHNGTRYLRVYPLGCMAIHEDSTRNRSPV
jgi:hypothetical protein